MDDLVAWLRAQIDEDERVAQAAILRTMPGSERWAADYEIGMQVRSGADTLVVRHSWPQQIEHITRHDPARVLREVEAKRRILDRYEDAVSRQTEPDESAIAADEQVREYEDWVLPQLAAVYADQPGYREDWAP